MTEESWPPELADALPDYVWHMECGRGLFAHSIPAYPADLAGCSSCA